MWLHSCDKNTGYFHAVTRGRQTCNRFTVIENAEGIAQYEEHQIAKVIFDFYQKMFSTKSRGDLRIVYEVLLLVISPETNCRLISIPDAEEIIEVVLAIHATKSPGPDGFFVGFFHSYWNIIGRDIVSEIKLSLKQKPSLQGWMKHMCDWFPRDEAPVRWLIISQSHYVTCLTRLLLNPSPNSSSQFCHCLSLKINRLLSPIGWYPIMFSSLTRCSTIFVFPML